MPSKVLVLKKLIISSLQCCRDWTCLGTCFFKGSKAGEGTARDVRRKMPRSLDLHMTHCIPHALHVCITAKMTPQNREHTTWSTDPSLTAPRHLACRSFTLNPTQMQQVPKLYALCSLPMLSFIDACSVRERSRACSQAL